MTDMFLMVVQEADGERPHLMYVAALDADAALAKVPTAAQDLFGSCPRTLKTWRIARNPVRWSFFECSWGEEKGEIICAFDKVPGSVRTILLRVAGSIDGLEAAFSMARMLVDSHGGGLQFDKEFDVKKAENAVEASYQTMDREAYARGWQAGLDDGLYARFNEKVKSKGGQA